ncbi:MAG TPA: MFS transporter [Ktedonobacteraceae bacterium]|jgi:MFS transporter, putative metabolite:H+ symporter|nr:MFS transporter [Ktedonobacteraceae bacterium]
MASETGSTPFPISESGAETRSTAAAVIARQDRIPIWSLSYLFIGIIGAGFLFTFFDIFDINVSFIQTCVTLVSGCTPPTSANYLGLPLLLNLSGYVVGALILSPLADRFGRRDILLVTLVITGLGSLYNAFVTDYANFIIARTITGIGVGADLALVATYIGEVAPSNGRAKYTSLIFIMSSLGAFFGIWLGLLLTTPATPFPLGLPFALAGAGFENGWRWMYGIGALLALIGILLRFQLPESPRWLITRGRTEEADKVVTSMEQHALKRLNTLPPVAEEISIPVGERNATYIEILGNPMYLRRTIILLLMWFVSFITVYAIGAGLTTILVSLGYPPPEAGLIAAVGTFGFIAVAVFDFAYGEALERKYWLPVSAVLTLVGGLVIALGGSGNFAIAAIGSIILFIGFNLFVPMCWAWSAENYPTRARASGFALVDGIGHIGGGVGIIVLAPLIPTLGAVGSFLVIGGCLIVSSVIALFGTATKNQRLDEVSP